MEKGMHDITDIFIDNAAIQILTDWSTHLLSSWVAAEGRWYKM